MKGHASSPMCRSLLVASHLTCSEDSPVSDRIICLRPTNELKTVRRNSSGAFVLDVLKMYVCLALPASPLYQKSVNCADDEIPKLT